MQPTSPFVNEEVNLIDLNSYSYKHRTEKDKHHPIVRRKVSIGIIEQVRKFLTANYRELFQQSIVNQKKREQLGRVISDFITQQNIVVPGYSSDSLVKNIVDSIAGLNVIQSLVEGPGSETITDVMVNGKDEIIVEDLNKGEYKTDLKFSSEEELYEVAMKIANASGETLTSAKPYADCRLPGMRIHIDLADICGLGIAITIRKHSKTLRVSDESMLQSGQANQLMINSFEAFVRGKLQTLIVGPTGSGKTELLKYLVKHIPNDDRFIFLEDTAETWLKNIYPEKHIVPMECKFTGDTETTIDLQVLLKNLLRQNPNRVGVGECRGPEVVYMLEILNTGHEGGITTGHANTAPDAIQRFIMMCLRSGMKLDPEVIGKWIVSTFDIVFLQEKMEDKVRRITEVIELVDYENNKLKYNPVFEYRVRGAEKDEKGRITKFHGEHIQTGYISLRAAKKMVKHGVEPSLIIPLLADVDKERMGWNE